MSVTGSIAELVGTTSGEHTTGSPTWPRSGVPKMGDPKAGRQF